MFSSLIKAKNIIFDILFPPLCLGCQKHLGAQTSIDSGAENHYKYNKFICDNCLSLIKLNNTSFCPICRARLPDNKRICGHAIPAPINTDKKHSHFYYLLAAAGNYDDLVLQNLIHYFKYKSFKNFAPFLGELAVNYVKNCKLKIENFIVAPIPLYPIRERKRGFNQAKLLSEFVAKNFNLELVEALKRIKNNKPQVECRDQETRIKNIKNCFAVKNPEKIRAKNILLVDDVFTSGATMNEAVKILKENGAGRIIALVLAKA